MQIAKIFLATSFFAISSFAMSNEMTTGFEPCPESPNCVSSLEAPDNEEHYIEPLVAAGGIEDLQLLKEAVVDLPGFKLVTEEEGYLKFEYTSRVLRFVDDVEFLYIENTELGYGYIHMKSASRVGYSDFGANRKRLEKIQKLWKDL